MMVRDSDRRMMVEIIRGSTVDRKGIKKSQFYSFSSAETTLKRLWSFRLMSTWAVEHDVIYEFVQKLRHE